MTMATATLQLLLAIILLLCSVSPALGQNNNSTASTGQVFTGPGYIACLLSDDKGEQPQCDYGIDPSCSIDEILSCNFTADMFLPKFDDSLSTLYIPLSCECSTASNCPSTCTFNEGDPPTRPPVGGTVDFTGIGSVTCITADFVSAPCYPTSDNFTACGTCDTSILTDTPPEIQFGEKFITFPLPCECFTMKDCPDTCTFTPGLNSTDSTPTATVTAVPITPPVTPTLGGATTATPAVTPITNSSSDIPIGDSTTLTPSLVPVNDTVPTPPTTTTVNNSSTTNAAPLRAPTSMVTVPTQTLNNNNNATSSAYENRNSTPFGKMVLIMIMSLISVFAW